MKITIEKTYTFNIAKEKKRLKSCFDGDILARQMALLEAFANGKFSKFIKLYNALPYDTGEFIHEQEYVHHLFVEFVNDCLTNGQKVVKIEH